MVIKNKARNSQKRVSNESLVEEGFHSDKTTFSMGNAILSQPLTPSWNPLNRQCFNADTNVKISWKRKQCHGGETSCILANMFFPPPQAWAFWEGHRYLGRRKTRHLGRCVLTSVSGTQGSNGTIMQNIMETFHRAMKIRKYLRFSKNSRMLSSVPDCLDSSPKP